MGREQNVFKSDLKFDLTQKLPLTFAVARSSSNGRDGGCSAPEGRGFHVLLILSTAIRGALLFSSGGKVRPFSGKTLLKRKKKMSLVSKG